MSHTLLNDVFKTLKVDCTLLMLPMTNEIFNENYTGSEEVILANQEHHLKKSGEENANRFSDNHFTIRKNNTLKRYHMECQSRPDSSILKRMAEYDTEIALENCTAYKKELHMALPYSSILYLGSTRNTPNQFNVRITSFNDCMVHNIRVMKLKDYTVNDIFEKQLYFLIPFHILVYKNSFPLYNKDMKKLSELQKIYEDIRDRLELLGQQEVLNEYYLGTIFDMTRKVLKHVTKKYKNINERLGDVMGGKVLEYPTKTAFRQAIQQGLQQGRLEMCISFIQDGRLSLSEAAVRLGMSESEIETCMTQTTC